MPQIPRRPPTRPPRLSRDAIIEAVTEFYTFLAKMYIPASSLKFPPEGGWPNITPETTRDFGKDPIVIDLMKHLPYIDDAEAQAFVTNIHYKCDVVDYSKWTQEKFAQHWDASDLEFLGNVLEDLGGDRDGDDDDDDNNNDDKGDDSDEYESEDEDDLSDAAWWSRYLGELGDSISMHHQLVLATGYESGGRTLVLDVYKGIIHEDMLRYNYLGWSPVEGFFRTLQEKYERLELVPVPSGPHYEGDVFEDVPEITEKGELKDPMGGLGTGEDGFRYDEKEDAKWFKSVYRRCGWPDLERYVKEEALAEIRRYTSQEGIW